jgi:hypothetical protein
MRELVAVELQQRLVKHFEGASEARPSHS